MSAAIKVVLDANILARFILTPHGFSGALLEAIESGRIQLITSETILGEVADVLARPHVQRYRRLSHDDIAEAIEALRFAALVVPGLYQVDVVAADPKDNPILACALEADAEFVVTDDRKHLLPLKHYHGVQIVSVPTFLKLLHR